MNMIDIAEYTKAAVAWADMLKREEARKMRYEAIFYGKGCGHKHLTSHAAMACGRKTLHPKCTTVKDHWSKNEEAQRREAHLEWTKSQA